jgi:hypothetical protein
MDEGVPRKAILSFCKVMYVGHLGFYCLLVLTTFVGKRRSIPAKDSVLHQDGREFLCCNLEYTARRPRLPP